MSPIQIKKLLKVGQVSIFSQGCIVPAFLLKHYYAVYYLLQHSISSSGRVWQQHKNFSGAGFVLKGTVHVSSWNPENNLFFLCHCIACSEYCNNITAISARNYKLGTCTRLNMLFQKISILLPWKVSWVELHPTPLKIPVNLHTFL